MQVTAEECPRIPRSFLEEERRTMGEQAYQQEYRCAFSDTDDYPKPPHRPRAGQN